MLKSEIISIGSELVSGQSLDTNSQWLSRQLGTGALKGGVLGANMTNNAFVATGEQLTQYFTSTGILLSLFR